MKAILFAMFVGLLMVGCGDGTVDHDDLEYRNGLYYLPSEETPFTGRTVSFYEKGKKELEWNYKDGKRDGLKTMWYRNGQKMEEINYKDDKKEGLATKWHENGQKRWEGNWKDGEPDGLRTLWSMDGSIYHRWTPEGR